MAAVAAPEYRLKWRAAPAAAQDPGSDSAGGATTMAPVLRAGWDGSPRRRLAEDAAERSAVVEEEGAPKALTVRRRMAELVREVQPTPGGRRRAAARRPAERRESYIYNSVGGAHHCYYCCAP